MLPKSIYALLSLLLFMGKPNRIDKGITQVVYSHMVKDSFDIKVFLPKKYDNTKKYNTVYFLDANINSGKAMIEHLSNKEFATIREKNIFIGIGNKINFHTQRNRDFLPPIMKDGKIEKSKDKKYGQADKFYDFLQKELIPMVEKKYSVSNKRSIIGHSYGGLFSFYCLLKGDKLFTTHFALSPSLWVNESNIFDYETAYRKTTTTLNAYLYMAVGTLEFANYVLFSSRRMNTLLKERNYEGLKITYVEKNWANHNSHIPLTLKEVLYKL